MNKTQLVIGITAFLLCSFTQVAQAQVGINTNSPVATLHILPSNANSASIAEGIIAPNLTLTQLAAKDNAYTTAQRGALVFVTDATGTTTAKTTNVSEAGYYHFDGTIWNRVGGSPWMVQATTNAASKNDQNIYQSGNVAIGGNNAINNSKLSVYGNTTIGETTNKKNLTINGTLNLTDRPNFNLADENGQPIVGVSALVVNTDTHEVGVASSIPSILMFAQSTTRQPGPKDEASLKRYNDGIDPLVVQWTEDDIVTNNYVDFDAVNYAFVFKGDTTAELSGYVNYIARTYSTELNAGVNINFEVLRSGSPDWEYLTITRAMLFPQNAQTIAISPVVSAFSAGDKVRVAAYRSVGGEHGKTADDYGFLPPVGSPVTKGIKILALK